MVGACCPLSWAPGLERTDWWGGSGQGHSGAKTEEPMKLSFFFFSFTLSHHFSNARPNIYSFMDQIPESFLKPEIYFGPSFDAGSQTEMHFPGFLPTLASGSCPDKAPAALIHPNSSLAHPWTDKASVTEPGRSWVVIDALRIVFRWWGKGLVWLNVAISTKHSTCGGILHLFWMNYLSTQPRSTGNWQSLEFGFDHHDLPEPLRCVWNWEDCGLDKHLNKQPDGQYYILSFSLPLHRLPHLESQSITCLAFHINVFDIQCHFSFSKLYIRGFEFMSKHWKGKINVKKK